MPLTRSRVLRLVLIVGVLTAGSAAAAGQPDRARVLVRYEGVVIETIVEGRGPAVVLLPSLARDSEDYDPVAEGLAASGFLVLRPQPRGMGKSVGPLVNITLHAFARDVAEVVKALGGGRAVIVGHAYGNWIARMTATDHPGLVRGVVIAAAAAKQYDPKLPGEIDKAGDPSLPDSVRLAALRVAFFAPGNDPKSWLTGWHPQVRQAQRAAAAAVPQAAWWAGGTAPLLELQADQDPFKTPDKRNEMKVEFGDRVTVAVVPGASHALFPEQPRAVVAALTRWISALQSRR